MITAKVGTQEARYIGAARQTARARRVAGSKPEQTTRAITAKPLVEKHR